MDGLADIPLQTPLHRPSTFNLDDAFSDDDSNELAYQFSPEAIREEIARSLPPMESAWSAGDSAHSNRFFEEQNLSVSTLDINGNRPASRSDSHSPPRTPRSPSPELSDQFSQISLDNGKDEVEEEHVEEHTTGHEVVHAYPNVIIDASAGKTHPQRISFVRDLEEPDDRIEHPSPPPSSFLEYPPDSAYSTQSLPPPAASQPSPSLPPPRPLSATPPIIFHPPSNSIFNPNSNPASIPSSSSAPQPQLKPPQKPSGHRPTRSTGPSIFEKVRSKTRPIFLPPKPRQEDDKHMADWQTMMKQSRAAADKRRKALQDRRLSREKHIEDSIHVWERDIVPDWRVVHKNPELRKLWWKGIPTKLRASMWERAVGNSLALSKDHYRTCLARAKRALLSGVFPQESLSLIEEDIRTTLPSLHIFHHETGPLYEELKEMLCAWVVSRSDEGLGYTLGAAKLAAMLLINMPAQQGFVVMRNLLERHCMRSFYGGEGSHEDVEAYYRSDILKILTLIFDTLLADGMPKIYFNFKQHQISPSAYLRGWLLPLFLDHLPFEACARVWDVLLLEGDAFLYRAALGILGVLEPRLFFPDRKELMELLKGENKAALEVAKREGRPLDGGKYEIYGVDEETLWERIDHMDEWWKESTWTRLLQRELPDL
ncbi:rab-GTPase-TBC domain-containing protein [Lyophyllum atratum]|nr:rab-GTPase-TBC domain-containing protein [Lyophyllum atratum]